MGFHSPKVSQKWTPSFSAEIVIEWEITATCRRCGKLIGHNHFVWDGEDMVDVVDNGKVGT